MVIQMPYRRKLTRAWVEQEISAACSLVQSALRYYNLLDENGQEMLNYATDRLARTQNIGRHI